MNSQQWNHIRAQTDIDNLMNVYGGFHDSCIKEMYYAGSGYVNSGFGMCNTKNATLKILFQRQYDNPCVLELMFNGVVSLNLKEPKNAFPDIYGTTILLDNDIIYWADSANWTLAEKSAARIWVSAKSLSWRSLKNYFGQEPLYNFIDC